MKIQYCSNCKQTNPLDAPECLKCGEVLQPTIRIELGKEIRQRINNQLASRLSPDAEASENAQAVSVSDIDYSDESDKQSSNMSNPGSTGKTTHIVKTSEEEVEIPFGKVLRPKEVILTEQQSGTIFKISVKINEAVVLGREGFDDLKSIDLTLIEAQEKGISRNHASIVRPGNFLAVVDHHSRNGTFLNGQRLVPEQIRILRDSDLLQLGLAKFLVNFD